MTVWSTTLHRIAGVQAQGRVSTFPEPFCNPVPGAPALAITSAANDRLVVRCGTHEQVLDRRELDDVLQELAASWPQLRRLRRAHWSGARISEMGRYVALIAEDGGSYAGFLGLRLTSREQIEKVGRWLEAWRQPIATRGGF